MPNKQRHRGMHPEDRELFGADRLPKLRNAVFDTCFLLTRGYAEKSAVALVGNHYQLTTRQRRAVLGASCSDQALARREAHRVKADNLNGATVAIDGYNLLIAIESALAGAILIEGRDGAIRDLASIHGSYRRVEETLPAVLTIGVYLHDAGVEKTHWYFDAPISNSGRLRALLLAEAENAGWAWEVELPDNPDRVLAESSHVVATGDSWILDRAERWTNLARQIIDSLPSSPGILSLYDPATGEKVR